MNIADLKPIKLAPWPWQERFALTCECCGELEELFCSRDKPLDGSRIRERLIQMALSALGWLLIREAGREVWLCTQCSVEVPDRTSSIFLAAASRWLTWKRIEVTVERAARS